MTETGFFSIGMTLNVIHMKLQKLLIFYSAVKAPGGIPYNDLNREAPPKVEAKGVPL